jgi:hypothetical protein
MTATASETSGWNAGASRRCGLTSVVSAPAMKPAGSKMISAGIRSRLASTCEPTASSKIRPMPIRTWSVVTAAPFRGSGPAAPTWADGGWRAADQPAFG